MRRCAQNPSAGKGDAPVAAVRRMTSLAIPLSPLPQLVKQTFAIGHPPRTRAASSGALGTTPARALPWHWKRREARSSSPHRPPQRTAAR